MPNLASQPHWIHIGYPKTGSTYLQHWFEGHPQIAYRPGGIAGLHTVYDLIETMFDNSNLKLCRVTSAEQLANPQSSGYYESSDPQLLQDGHAASRIACDALAEMFPEAHILIVTRGIRGLLESGYSQLVRQGADILPEGFFQFDRGRLEDLQLLDFDHTISLYRKKFGERVLVLPYEMLVEDRRAFLAIIEQSMGLGCFDIGLDRINPSLSGPELYWYPRFAKIIRKFPVGRIGARLLGIHRALIASGGWKPVLKTLQIIFGRKEAVFDPPPSFLALFDGKTCQLANNPHHADYRSEYAPSVQPASG